MTIPNYEQIGKAYLAIAPFLRHRLIASATELTPIFQALPAGCGDLLVLITNAAPAGPAQGRINPRQSFLWDSKAQHIRSFEQFEELAAVMLERSSDLNLSRNIDSIEAEIAEGNCRFERFADTRGERTVHIYVEPTRCPQEARVFLGVLATYLELFRTSTTHSHNDMYSTRADELSSFVSLMKPSVAETAKELVLWIGDQPRFGSPEWCVFEYLHDWKLHAVSSDEMRQSAAEVVSNANTKRLLGEGKFTVAKVMISKNDARQAEVRWALVAPFARLYDELSFDGPEAPIPYRTRPAKAPRSRVLLGGDCAVVLFHRTPPHPNVLHTIVRYRQYYFEVYLPGVIHHVKQVIYQRARQLHADSTRNWRDPKNGLWQSFKDLCDDVFPRVFEALDVSGGVSILRIECNELYTLVTRDVTNTPRSSGDEQSRWLSLAKGKRGMVATTFLDPEFLDMVCDDIPEAVRNAARTRHAFPYTEQRSETRSEYCIKLLYKDTPIGVVNFESIRVGAFTGTVINLIKSFVQSLEHYIHEHLAAADSHWLSITAASYHNLHELRQLASAWSQEPYKSSVMTAIAAFDRAEDDGSAALTELGDFLKRTLDTRLAHVPATSRAAMQIEADRRCKFRINPPGELPSPQLPRVRVELMKRVAKNLLSNFDLGGPQMPFSSFKVLLSTVPSARLHFRQEHFEPFKTEWLEDVGFAPLVGQSDGERMHHGLFLCGAIARSLGGFLFAGNAQDPDIGHRSRLEIVVPLQEGRRWKSRADLAPPRGISRSDAKK